KYMLDWCARAMKGEGTVIIGDCPLQGCNFQKLMALSHMDEIVQQANQQYPHLVVKTEDWRLTVLNRQEYLGRSTYAQQSIKDDTDAGSLRDYTLVDVGQESFLEEISDYAEYFRVTMYKPSLMLAHHCPGKHEYLLTKRFCHTDLLINLPKMKTHIKTGLTGALKNLVGINGHKEFLPHHIRGSYFTGGDCYCVDNLFSRWADKVYDSWWETYTEMPFLKRKTFSFFYHLLHAVAGKTGGDRISAGSWSGNETLWRTILDLNHILYFSPNAPKRIITIIDGIVAGEGEGPLTPSPKKAGLLVGGENPAFVDAVLARLMGYNISRIPMVYHALTHRRSKLAASDIKDFVVDILEGGKLEPLPINQLPPIGFKKPAYWRRASIPLSAIR
ncbi:MAG: DUF362 domain-containing protein, partial [bacterium]